jgi:manganese-dependent inorganic pyrophosphatase
MSKILITAKISPDLDGVACAYAYAKLMNSVDKDNEYIAGIYGEPQIEVKYLLNRFCIKRDLFFNPKDKFDKFILVDASDTKGMPECLRPEDVIEVIDHREIHRAPELFPTAKIQVEKVGAAATLIFEKFQEMKMPIDSDSLYLLLGAIYSNTLNFKSDISTQRDIDAVVFLRNLNTCIPTALIDEIFKHKTKFIFLNLEKVIINDFKYFDSNLGIAQLEGFNLNDIVNKKHKKIELVLNKLKEKHNLKYIFLTAADIKNSYNIFVTIDEDTRLLLAKSMNLVFNEKGIAKNHKLLLRKQIMPLLSDYL